MHRVKVELLILFISIIFCSCDNSKNTVNSNTNSITSCTTEVSSVCTDTITDINSDISEHSTAVYDKNIILPKEAEQALFNYLKCDSISSLADSILPSSVAEEMKNGNLIQGNYFFAGYPCNDYKDEEISECTTLTKQEANNLAEFWATGVSMQGISADFSSDEGYNVVVSATFTIEGEMDTMTFRITNRLAILKITDDGWIIVPSSDMDTYKMEVIE